MSLKDPEAYREYQRRYREEHTEELREYRQEWARKNPEKVRLAKKRTPEAWAKACAYRKRYYAEHRDEARANALRWAKENPERMNARNKKWRTANPQKAGEVQRRRRLRLQGNRVERINPLILAERDDWRCHLCDGEVTEATFSLDHVVPVSQGGAHTYENLRLAHRRCNSIRGVLPVDKARDKIALRG